MEEMDNPVLKVFIEKYLPVIFLVVLILVLSYQRFVDYIIRFKYTGLILLVLKICIRILSGAFLNIIVLPVLLAAYLLQWIFSMANNLYVQIAIRGNVTRASGFDCVFGFDSNISPAFINAQFKINGKFDIENFRKHCSEKIINVKSSSGQIQFPKFKQLFRNYGGYFYWIDDQNFDIRNHIYAKNVCQMYPQLSSKEGVSGQDLICRYIDDHGLDIIKDGNAPQWEMTCLQTGNEDFFLHVRIHHSYGDGLSFRRLILEYLSDEPSTDNIVLAVPSLRSRILRTLWAISLIPYAIAVMLYKGSCNPLHKSKGLKGKKFFVAMPEIPFKLIRDIKMKSKTTVQSVLFSATTNAFGKKFHISSSKVAWLTAFYIVGITDPTSELKLENTFMMGLVSLPVPAFKSIDGKLYQENSSYYNLCRTNLALRGAQEDATILALYYLLTVYVNVLPIFLGRIISSCSGITAGLSNMPGPRKHFTVMKHELSEMRVWPPDKSPSGITIAYTSSSGVLRASMVIDGALVNSREEAEEIGNNLVAEIKTLGKELGIKDTSE